ncbi:MAG TPA: elongation factor Ts [Candidatus Omnitrophota bacterium]|nr:elongation factor Ts [Candidatus Omnitrophota bacterium]HPT07260.1 elongation factor Ts [Candidatus Omnitrophota bacterium]
MAVSLDSIKELREMTAASIADCRKALADSTGDIKKAAELLRKRGLEIAAKKSDRAAKEGRIEAYVHMGNKIGVLLEVDSETDFVSRSPDFCQFTKDIAMHIAACSPTYVKKEDVPAEIIEQEKDKELFYKEHCLLQQPFVKDPSITVNDYLSTLFAKFSENLIVRRFVRYQIGA